MSTGESEAEEAIRTRLMMMRQAEGWHDGMLKALVTTVIVADIPDVDRRAFFAELLDQALAKLNGPDRMRAIEIADSRGGLEALRFVMGRRMKGDD